MQSSQCQLEDDVGDASVNVVEVNPVPRIIEINFWTVLNDLDQVVDPWVEDTYCQESCVNVI
jgi:hypothetical protein